MQNTVFTTDIRHIQELLGHTSVRTTSAIPMQPAEKLWQAKPS